MNITFLLADDDRLIQHAAQLLVDAFREHWPDAWPTLEEGLEEVHEMLESGRICRVAVDENGDLLGIIGGIPGYDGHVWELHPLAVQPSLQGQGIGRILVTDFEEQVRSKGGLTITLGTDDEDNMTSLSGVDLYENLWERIRDIRNLKNHPFEFYEKMGYVITGVVPDANGAGKPDILMAKKVSKLWSAGACSCRVQRQAVGLHTQCVSVTLVMERGVSVSYPLTLVRWQANN